MSARLVSSALLLTFLLVPAPAQQPSPIDGTGQHIAGKRPGTMRYLVTFGTRGFDLEGFRTAVLERRSAAAIDAIVADLDRKAKAHQKDFVTQVRRLGGEVDQQYWIVNGCAIEAPPAAIAELRTFANVESIEGDHTTMPLILVSTNAANHNSDAVNAAGNRGANVAVAIMDTGLDALSGATGKPHPTFFINGDVNNTTGKGLMGSRLLENVQVGLLAPDNTHPHGTGVAGIAAGAKWFNNAAYDDGHAPLAGVVGYSISDSASGQASESGMTMAWQRIAGHRIKHNIVAANNSYTGYSCSVVNMIAKAMDNATYFADVLAVTAAGNGGGGAGTQYSQPNVNGLAVAATNATSKTMAGFSSFGPILCTDASQFWPDISACGVNTVMPMNDNPAGTYTASGTSMASPQVCGAAALVRNANQSLNAQETKAILLATTESIAAQNAGRTRQNFGQGFLRDDLAVALATRIGNAFTRTLSSTTTPSVHPIQVTASVPVRVVLVWPRRIDTSINTQWSDLALRVLDGANNPVASSNDLRQLYEAVTFTPASSGIFRIEVSASLLEGGGAVEYSIAHTATSVGYVTGSFSLFGTGCAGSVVGGPGLSSSDAPTIGAFWRLQIEKARANSVAGIAIGVSNTTWGPVALPWPVINAPGCFVNASLDIVVTSTTNANGDFAVNMRIPADITFINARFYAQGLVADPVNALGIVTTRGGNALVGGLP